MSDIVPKGNDPKILKPLSPFWRWSREILGVVTWATLCLFLLRIDLIGLLMSRLSGPSWIATYFPLILLGLFCLFWVLMGTDRFLRTFGFIVLYPILLFFRLVWRLLKNWPVLVAFSPAIYSVAVSFKSVFIAYAVTIIGCFLIAVAEPVWAISTGIAFISYALISHYYRQLRSMFSTGNVFKAAAEEVSKLWKTVTLRPEFQPPSEIDLSTDAGKTRFSHALLPSYASTITLSWFAKKVTAVAESRKVDLFLAFSWCYTMVLTIIAYSFLYFGLSRLPGDHFGANVDAGYLDFLGYSICVISTSDISGIAAQSKVAIFLAYSELLGNISLVVVFFYLLQSCLGSRYHSDLSRIASELESASSEFESFIQDNFSLSLEAAEDSIVRYQREIARLLLRIRYRNDEVERIFSQSEDLRNLASADPSNSVSFIPEPKTSLKAKSKSTGRGKRKKNPE